MNAEVNAAVEQLKGAGTNPSKQVPALVELCEWYLKKAKTTSNAADFTKADALYNAAFVRSRSANHEINEDQILQQIVEIYREFLRTFAHGDTKVNVDEIRNEIRSHKEFLLKERQSFKERFGEIESFHNKNDKTKEEHQIHATKIHELFRDIQNMYIRLVSMLAKECESKLGQPPCNYAIIALGSVARMQATPFSDLEFAILLSDQATGDKINYFRVLTHFLHLKVINLGETILPALGIKELNDFQSLDPNGSWFYDSETPRGISFDGAMPWASKTPLGRMETKNKPALELIRTPEQMAKFQDEEVALKEGYHLADIMLRPALLYGDEALPNKYNELVTEKLNAKSLKTSVFSAKSSEPCTVGVTRGMEQMLLDIQRHGPFSSTVGTSFTVPGSQFNAKNQFYRFISLFLSDLGMIFDITCPSPWHIISALLIQGVISVSQSLEMKECLSFSNEVRLRTYFVNNRQKELFSSLPHYANQDADAAVVQDVHEDILVHFLSTSYNIHRRCLEFFKKCISQGKVDSSIFRETPTVFSNAVRRGYYYYRLQNFQEALKWWKSESKDSPEYGASLLGQGNIYLHFGEYDKCIECFEEALQLGYRDGSDVDVVNGLATALHRVGKYKMAIDAVEKAIQKHKKMFGERNQTVSLLLLRGNLGFIYQNLEDFGLAVKNFKRAEEIQKELSSVDLYLAMFLNMNMARSLSELDQHEESIAYIEKALQLSHQIYGEHNLSSTLAEVYYTAGHVYGRSNREGKAENFFKRSLELYERMVGDLPHEGKLNVLIDFGVFFFRRHQTGKAVEKYESALKLARALNDKKPHRNLAQILSNMGAALGEAGMPDKSLPYLAEAKEIMDKLLGPNHFHPLTLRILANMALTHRSLGNLPEALRCFNDAFTMNYQLYGENDNYGGMEGFCYEIGRTLTAMARFDEAKKYYMKAYEIAKKHPLTKTKCCTVMKILHFLALTCFLFGQHNEALKHLEEARKIAKDTGYKDWLVVGVLVELIRGYAKMACIPKSLLCYLEAREMAKSLPKEHSLPDMILDMLKLMKT